MAGKRISWRISLALIALALFLLPLTFHCGGKAESENEPAPAAEPQRDVPEVDAFLDAFRPVMIANADGEMQAVRDSVPSLYAAGESLLDATLPAFHNDIKAAFDRQRQSLMAGLDTLKAAAQGESDELLSEAVDLVRQEFVKIITLLAPSIAEIDSFHEILQPLWHEATPNQDYDAIKAAIPELKLRAEAIVKSELPEKYKFLEEEFHKKRVALQDAVDELGRVCEANLDDQIEDKMYLMHEAYHDLVDCLE